MSIASIRAQAHAVSGVPFEDRPMAAAVVGETLERELADPRFLVETSMRLVEVAHNLGCTAITGASALGERLAAAAVAVGKNGLHMYRTHEQDPVLIVDGILVTGSQIMSAAMRLNSEGAPRPAAAVVVSTCDIDLSSAIDQLVVLEP